MEEQRARQAARRTEQTHDFRQRGPRSARHGSDDGALRSETHRVPRLDLHFVLRSAQKTLEHRSVIIRIDHFLLGYRFWIVCRPVEDDELQDGRTRRLLGFAPRYPNGRRGRRRDGQLRRFRHAHKVHGVDNSVSAVRIANRASVIALRAPVHT